MQMILKSKKREKKEILGLFPIDFSLKEQQSVLIEFNAFPSCLIDYLQSCIRDQDAHTPSNK